MLNDPALGLNLSQVGGLTSVLPLAYGMSKFVSGVLGSRTSPTVLLAGELMLFLRCWTCLCTEPHAWSAAPNDKQPQTPITANVDGSGNVKSVCKAACNEASGHQLDMVLTLPLLSHPTSQVPMWALITFDRSVV